MTGSTAPTAYELSARADGLLRRSDLENARTLMQRAAELDATYVVRARFFGRTDPRPARVTSTFRRRVAPFLEGHGFKPIEPGPWREGVWYTRVRGDATHTLGPGRHEFGHRFGFIAARHRKGGQAEYFDWQGSGNHTGAVAYTNQQEFEEACLVLIDLLRLHAFP